MADPKTKTPAERYALLTRLSSNNSAESWLAENRLTGKKCFVKTAPISGDTSVSSPAGILERSFSFQSRLRSGLILTAVACHKDDSRVYVEYPYVETLTSDPMSSGVLFKETGQLLVDISLAADFLHAMGLVHCDLKIENFRSRRIKGEMRHILVDLDTLHEINTKWSGRVVGTPGMVAPEIMTGDYLTGKSDLFSLGKSLEELITGHVAEGDEPARATEMLERLHRLTGLLTLPTPDQRPPSAIDALRSSGLIDDSKAAEFKKTLLAMLLTGTFRRVRTRLADERVSIQKALFQESGLYSVPDDLAGATLSAFRVSPRETLDTFKWLWRVTYIHQFGDYWQLALTDENLLEAFVRLDRVAPVQHRQAKQKSESPTGGLRQYLFLKQEWRGRCADGVVGRDVLAMLTSLSDLARQLNRPDEAAEFLGEMLQRLTPGVSEHSETAERLVLQLYAAGKVDEGFHRSVAFAEQYLVLEPRSAFPFERLAAWAMIVRGDQTEAEVRLRALIERSRDAGDITSQVRAIGMLAGALKAGGRTDVAHQTYAECLKLARKNGLEPAISSAIAAYAALCYETGDFSKAVRLGRLAHTSASATGDLYLAHHALESVVAGLIRLGDYREAERVIGQWLQTIHLHGGKLQYAEYYLNLGWLHTVRCEVVPARQNLAKALGIVEHSPTSVVTVLANKNLAYLALMQGRRGDCLEHVEQGCAVAGNLKDAVSLAEFEYLRTACDLLYGAPPDAERLANTLLNLMNLNCASYAGLAYLVLLAGRQDDIARQARGYFSDDNIDRMARQGPIGGAARPLFKCEIDSALSWDDWLRTAKSSCRILDSAGHRFTTSLLCERIADQCHLHDHPKLGERFLAHATTLANDLGNGPLTQRLTSRQNERGRLRYEKRALMDTIAGISQVIKNLATYRNALESIVTLATRMTEAERGVLLTRESAGGELQVRAYVNCDDKSLRPITDFSRSIAATALERQQVFVAHDALADERTKGSKSIFEHNIRSLLCVPVAPAGQVEAILYLDHHTIPALFDDEDVQFVTALAEVVSVVLSKAREQRRLNARTSYLEEYLASEGHNLVFISQDPVVLGLLESLPAIATSDASVLIRGESGTGKEILCNLIHAQSGRADRPLVKLNCASMPETLVESELFGTVKGAATGVATRAGRFEAADGGTLFLDEVGDLPLKVQAKVLRVIENQEFQRVGSNRTIHTDIRFVYATHQDLRAMVSQGTFREDLFYRICAVEVDIPPLRDRPGDIQPLIDHFARLFAKGNARPVRFSPQAAALLGVYDWPGNVRELRNLVERLSIFACRDGTIGVSELPREMRLPGGDSFGSKDRTARLEKSVILGALIANEWNQSASAKELGLTLSTLRRKIKKYNLNRP
ncbi:MAG: sigma 54-interacting transcriptional regulator [Candidatus Zixiibacteriota bacterium]